jgi:hypothetical protein
MRTKALMTGTAFVPGETLIADAQSLQASLGTAVKVAPTVGAVLSTSDAGTAGRTVNLLSGKTVIATARTDAVGSCYFDRPIANRSAFASLPEEL